MRKVISSGWTLVFKVLVPATLVLVSLILLISLLVFPAKVSSDALIGTLMVVAATLFFCWWGAILKQVSIDERNFYVAGFIHEIAIPFTDVQSINALQGGWPVIVRLKAASPFGRTIFFLADWQPFLFGSPHPVLGHLRQLMNKTKNG